MMAVLVEFDDDAKATAFVEKVNGRFGTPEVPHSASRRRVTGVWKVPTNFCACADQGKKMEIQAYSRGRKYGWWVHTCGRPSKFWVKAKARLWDAMGRNILPGADDDPKWLTPTHERDHDNLVMDDAMQGVGAPWKSDKDNAKTLRRQRRKAMRPRRGDGTVAGH
jgi:hypothetical protein